MQCNILDVKVLPQAENETLHEQDEFRISYCIAFRDPSLPEWILARGVRNDNGIRSDDPADVREVLPDKEYQNG